MLEIIAKGMLAILFVSAAAMAGFFSSRYLERKEAAVQQELADQKIGELQLKLDQALGSAEIQAARADRAIAEAAAQQKLADQKAIGLQLKLDQTKSLIEIEAARADRANKVVAEISNDSDLGLPFAVKEIVQAVGKMHLEIMDLPKDATEFQKTSAKERFERLVFAIEKMPTKIAAEIVDVHNAEADTAIVVARIPGTSLSPLKAAKLNEAVASPFVVINPVELSVPDASVMSLKKGQAVWIVGLLGADNRRYGYSEKPRVKIFNYCGLYFSLFDFEILPFE